MTNSSTVNPEDCTLQTCSLDYARIDYIPSLPANATYLSFFSLILVVQIGLGSRYRTWGFMAGMFCGILLEILGYIGPAFVSASIYLCLGRLINTIGAEISRFKPRTYACVFVFCDVISILLQVVGGAITASARDNYQDANARRVRQKGVHIMLGGLAYQVFSLTLFMILWGEFSLRASKAPAEMKNQGFEKLRSTFKFKAFRPALWLATICIFIRSVFRVVELNQGFGGPIANNEPSFLVLEGPMIIIATGVLTIFHPGVCFAGNWDAADWSLRAEDKGNKDKQSL
ncbi:hypothetical protein GP486_005125 [Trichoglossum hirsutum]|uniref:Sphingoid long-chain base transporter RSB1 n=1 Tax=Trichoglossum hirsutum TaxID=265104 RepID=A0A9P8L9V2_9PEZI|nr:hypothetical protein GP486_005125 [Trichoglossum hirsutum]